MDYSKLKLDGSPVNYGIPAIITFVLKNRLILINQSTSEYRIIDMATKLQVNAGTLKRLSNENVPGNFIAIQLKDGTIFISNPITANINATRYDIVGDNLIAMQDMRFTWPSAAGPIILYAGENHIFGYTTNTQLIYATFTATTISSVSSTIVTSIYDRANIIDVKVLDNANMLVLRKVSTTFLLDYSNGLTSQKFSLTLPYQPRGMVVSDDKTKVLVVFNNGAYAIYQINPTNFILVTSGNLGIGAITDTLLPTKNGFFAVSSTNKTLFTYNVATNTVISAFTSLDDTRYAGENDYTVVLKKYVNSNWSEIQFLTTNSAPTVSVTSPTANQTLYENDSFNIAGTAIDTDPNQSVTVYYQIDDNPKKVLAANLSQIQIALSKVLTFKGGKMFDGITVVTGALADGVAHTLKVWAEDGEKASSSIIERTFYVVSNRAPLLTVDPIILGGIIDTDKFKIKGSAGDPDANAIVKVSYRINNGNPVQIYNGPGGVWELEITLSQLVVGENTIIVEVIDNYGAKTSKTIKLNKNTVKTPILQSVARYKISPPKGSARGVLIWVQRDEELDLTVELSMTLAGEQEQYILLEADPDNIVEVSEGIVEDEYYHETVEPKDNIILKLTTSRANVNIDDKIYLVWGVLE